MEYYHLSVAGVERDLPIVRVTDTLSIASFVILGDAELSIKAANALIPKLPEFDILITAEAKGIPLVQELAHLLCIPNYIVARKNIKAYMTEPFTTEVFSITSQQKQILCLDKKESDSMKGKKVLIVDDVISTGESLKAIKHLVKSAGGKIVGAAAILAEGKASDRKDIIFLEKLPLFPVKPSR